MDILLFGKPLFIWAGILGFICIAAAALIGITKYKFKYHKWLAITGTALATLHVMGAFFGS